MSKGTTQPLTSLTIAQQGCVKAIHAQGALKHKLFNMGFIPGVDVKLIRAAPLNDPLEFELLDYFVTLRKDEALLIEVEVK